MKLHRILILLTLGALFALPSTSFAAKGAKAGKGAGKGQRPFQIVKKYDTNNNGQIDGAEIDALKKDFAANPKGPLAALDKNGNGTLEDDEVTALNARLSKRADRIAKKAQAKEAQPKSNNT